MGKDKAKFTIGVNQANHGRVVDRVAEGGAYEWPGNVRELENVLMKGIALSHSNTFTPELLPDYICSLTTTDKSRPVEKPVSELSLEEMEKIHVARVLEATAWHKGRACEVLNISRPRLRRMINHFNLTPPTNEDLEME